RVTAFAITQYEKSIELDSTRAEVHNKLGKLYYKERRYNDAAREYQHVAALDTTNESVLLELARMYMVSRPKQYANAARILKLYIQRFPNSEEVWPTYTEALYYTRQYAEAIKAAQRVLKSDPKNAQVLRFMASSQSILKQHKESIESYNKLRSLDTLKVNDLEDLADAYSDLKKDTLTLQTYEEIVNIDPNQKDIYNKMGTILMNWKKWDRAALMFQKCFTLDSTYYGAFINFAQCNMVLERYDTARVALRYVTSKRSEYAPGHLYLARTLTALDSLQAAKKEYEEWLKLIPQGEEAKYKRELAEAYKVIGASYLPEKKYPQAIENLSKSFKYRDDDWQTHLWIAQAYHLSGNKEEAIKEYKKVLKLNPTNKDAKNALELLGIPVD
ncbi:MAG: tetratricopeptide repeat protein, partial [Bacteroidota bacterium]